MCTLQLQPWSLTCPPWGLGWSLAPRMPRFLTKNEHEWEPPTVRRALVLFNWTWIPWCQDVPAGLGDSCPSCRRPPPLTTENYLDRNCPSNTGS